jgi:alpha-galactosidase
MGDCFFGDFYPLTPYTQSPNEWIAWQYDQPEKGTGVVQAFRREQSIYESARLRLNGLKRDAMYEVTDLQTGASTRESATNLIDNGLRIAIPAQPAAAVLKYHSLN